MFKLFFFISKPEIKKIITLQKGTWQINIISYWAKQVSILLLISTN